LKEKAVPEAITKEKEKRADDEEQKKPKS